jgi:hypothetical protein
MPNLSFSSIILIYLLESTLPAEVFLLKLSHFLDLLLFVLQVLMRPLLGCQFQSQEALTQLNFIPRKKVHSSMNQLVHQDTFCAHSQNANFSYLYWVTLFASKILPYYDQCHF